MELCAATLQDLVLGAYKGPKVGNHRQILHQISLGVEFLHSKGIVHRDINPHNIYISIPNGSKPPTMKVGDFGMRRMIRHGRFSLDQVAGTKDFMAPEVFHSNAFTCAMDIYSLACSFGYTLTEKRINAVKKSRSYKAVYSILFELIRSMLNPNPKLRPSATQVLNNAFFNADAGRFLNNDILASQVSVSSQPMLGQASGKIVKILLIY
jgi:serine/threonine protein kinase